MQLSEAELVWNRAAMQRGGAAARAGDLALASVLLAHGRICNGGVWHAVDSMSPDQLATASDAYGFFGLPEVAELLQTPPDASEAEFDIAERRYGELIPTDDVLVDRFKTVFAASRDLFASV
jgi:hypothetical protein